MWRKSLIAICVAGTLGCNSGEQAQPGAGKPPAAQPAPPAAVAVPGQPLKTAPVDSLHPLGPSSLLFLTRMVGRTPLEVDLWRTKPTMLRLHDMLGDEGFQAFIICTQESGPIQLDNGFYFVVGNKKYGAATDAAVFVADVERDMIYVWMKVMGTPEEHAERGWVGPLPKSVQAAIAKAAKG
jgi:hypothetical protein